MARDMLSEAAVLRRLPSMTAMTYFYQACPVCGRNLRIPVKHFGRQMSCSHCHGEFRSGKGQLPPSAEPFAAEESQTPAAAFGPGFATPQLGEV
jgi:hypothetical protein